MESMLPPVTEALATSLHADVAPLQEIVDLLADADTPLVFGGHQAEVDALAAEREPHTIQAFVELHIEQGPVLETRGVPVGVVEGIVAEDHVDLADASAGQCLDGAPGERAAE